MTSGTTDTSKGVLDALHPDEVPRAARLHRGRRAHRRSLDLPVLGAHGGDGRADRSRDRPDRVQPHHELRARSLEDRPDGGAQPDRHRGRRAPCRIALDLRVRRRDGERLGPACGRRPRSRLPRPHHEAAGRLQLSQGGSAERRHRVASGLACAAGRRSPRTRMSQPRRPFRLWERQRRSKGRRAMKVFVAGATGVVGRRLVPLLVAAGYEVSGSTRSPEKAGWLRDVGAGAIVVDALDRTAVMQALIQARPEVVIHEMTGLTGAKSFKKFDDEFALTNRLRTDGTDYLLEAARAAGARRLIAQSYGNWNYERSGSSAKTEDDPFDPNPPANQRQTLEGIVYLEQAVTGARDIEGIALRHANHYGPGTSFAVDGGDLVTLVRKRQLPVIGDGGGVWSFIHVDDLARATIAAIEHGRPGGVYNVVDDEPVAAATWIPGLAEAVGAKPPRHVPVWLGKLAAGEVGVSMMTQMRGTSNAKAKRELGWEPHYTSWR